MAERKNTITSTDHKDSKELANWASSVKWEEYVTDSNIHNSLESIRNRINEINKQKKSTTTTTSSSTNTNSNSGNTNSTSVDENHSNTNQDNKTNEDLRNAERVKLVVVGDGAVGKTSLLISYSTGTFPTEYLPTVFENYTAQMKREHDVILLHLWDTAGQEDYDRLRPLSYPGADIVLLCFSTISSASYEAIKEKWAPEIHHYIPTVPYILVGTKTDLRTAKTPDPNTNVYQPINPEDGKKLANEIGATQYMEICSKTQEGVKELFNEAVNLVMKERGITTNGTKETNVVVVKKKKGGCLLI